MKYPFITEDDPWEIRSTVRKIFIAHVKGQYLYENDLELLVFSVFYNQYIPPAWRESKETVLRHVEEIKLILRRPDYSTNFVWIKRNNQIKCGLVSQQLQESIMQKKVTLPTYMEIEESKMEWQKAPRYRKEEGFSVPIREEVIQLRIQKRR